jgi:hypothetical protein
MGPELGDLATAPRLLSPPATRTYSVSHWIGWKPGYGPQSALAGRLDRRLARSVSPA